MKLTIEIDGDLSDARIAQAMEIVQRNLSGTNYVRSGWELRPISSPPGPEPADTLPPGIVVRTGLDS